MNEQSIHQVGALSTKRAAEYLGVSDSFLRKTRMKRKPDEERIEGPTYKKVGTKVIYTIEFLQEWLEQLPTRSA